MKEISALMVVYHEEDVINRCLQSLSKVTDEIIIIHDGPCQDKTLEIAKKYTDQIHEMEEHKGIGESWYIKGFKLCNNEWILRIDADEYLSDELQNELRKLVKTDTYDAYSFVWPMWDGEKYISFRALRKNFLFRKSKIGFIDKFHYPIKVLGKICNSNLIVHHKPRYNNWTKETFEKKQKKWAALQASDHLVPIEEREILNLDIGSLKKEQTYKNHYYQFPSLVLIGTYILQLFSLINSPKLIFDKGFWIVARVSSLYSYEVAKRVKKLYNSN